MKAVRAARGRYLYFAGVYIVAEMLAIPAVPLTASAGWEETPPHQRQGAGERGSEEGVREGSERASTPTETRREQGREEGRGRRE